jgi:predicted kinase
MKIFYMLVGLPGCGKSTWVKKNAPKAIVASSDYFVEEYATVMKKTYNEVFTEVAKDAQKSCDDVARTALNAGEPLVVWDQTNLSSKVRKSRLSFVPEGYRKVALVVKCSDENEWNTRLVSRPGKSIPDFVLKTMANSFEMPTLEEGFDEVITVDTASNTNEHAA